MLTQQRVQELLVYDRDTGKLFWRKRKGVREGREAGCVSDRDGYRRICIDFVDYLAHRVIWLCETGEAPPEHIDHVNMARDDNRFANLRPATKSENGFNRRKPKNNSTGFKGVCFDKARGNYLAKICVNYEQINIGRFNSAEAAHAAYAEAAGRLHGDYARVS